MFDNTRSDRSDWREAPGESRGANDVSESLQQSRAGTRARPALMSGLLRPQNLRLFALGALGLCLIIAGSAIGRGKADTTESEPASLDALESSIAASVEKALGSVRGAGKVAVTITLGTGQESMFAKDLQRTRTAQSETYPTGEVRESTNESETSRPVTSQLGSSGSPLLEKVMGAKVAGCLVVAEGASDSEIKAQIYSAVKALLDIPIYKIQVLPMKGGN